MLIFPKQINKHTKTKQTNNTGLKQFSKLPEKTNVSLFSFDGLTHPLDKFSLSPQLYGED